MNKSYKGGVAAFIRASRDVFTIVGNPSDEWTQTKLNYVISNDKNTPPPGQNKAKVAKNLNPTA